MVGGKHWEAGHGGEILRPVCKKKSRECEPVEFSVFCFVLYLFISAWLRPTVTSLFVP